MTWKGKNYVIPPSRVLRAIARVEDIVTMQQLTASPSIPFAKLSMAYTSLLRFAGASVEEEEVYEVLWDRTEGGNASVMVNTLLQMMLPKKVRENIKRQVEDEMLRVQKLGEAGAGAPEEGKEEAPINVAL